MKLKLRWVGIAAAILLPKKMLHRLKLVVGASLFTAETPEGCLITPHDPEVVRQFTKGQEFMAKYRETFRALAK